MRTEIDSKHILGLDILRFAAACLVVAFHYCFLMGATPKSWIGSASRGLVKFPELYDFTNFGWVGVEIFFVISGFVIAFSGEKSTAFSFLRSRIVRLGPAVWICAPITLIATMLVGFRPDEDMYRAFRHSMAFLPWEPWIDSSYWTLGIEISFYAAVLALIRFSKFGHITVLAIILGLVSSLFWMARATMEIHGISAFVPEMQWLFKSRISKLLLIHHGMFFALGVFLWSELIKKRESKNIFWIVVFSIAGCAQIVANAELARTEMYVDCSAIVPCILFLVSIALIVLSVRLNAVFHALPSSMVKAIKIAGMMTYPLYLLHQTMGGAIMGWMVANGSDRWTALVVSTFIIFGITWIIATQLEPWLQYWTKYIITKMHNHFNREEIRFVK